MDDSKTVEAFLESQGVTIASFTRFEVGDGDEKAANDFESEVALRWLLLGQTKAINS